MAILPDVANALELVFDRATDAAIRAMWASLEARGLPSMASRSHGRHRPHVSLVVADRVSVDQARYAVADLDDVSELCLRLGSVAVFPGRSGVLYLGIVPTRRLLTLHHEVHGRLAAAGVEADRHYLPDAWVPHCTLAQGLAPEQVPEGVRAVKRLRPLDGDVVGVSLVDTDTGRRTDLTDLPRNADDE